MLKLYFGTISASISTLLLLTNLGYMLGCFFTSTQKWGYFILIFILLNGLYWYFANIRDLYSDSIVHAIDGSREDGIFSANSIQSFIYWCGSILIWIAGIIAFFKPELRYPIFVIMTIIACIQFACIEVSRLLLYSHVPARFDYMKER